MTGPEGALPELGTGYVGVAQEMASEQMLELNGLLSAEERTPELREKVEQLAAFAHEVASDANLDLVLAK